MSLVRTLTNDIPEESGMSFLESKASLFDSKQKKNITLTRTEPEGGRERAREEREIPKHPF
jgi:hypothetical protein